MASMFTQEFYTNGTTAGVKDKSAVHAEGKVGGIQAAGPQNSTMKRNVQKMSEQMKREITKIEGTFKLFEHHVYTVLKNSIIGPTTSYINV